MALTRIPLDQMAKKDVLDRFEYDFGPYPENYIFEDGKIAILNNQSTSSGEDWRPAISLEATGDYDSAGLVVTGLLSRHEQTNRSGDNHVVSVSIYGYALNNGSGDNDIVGVGGRARKLNVDGGVGDSCGTFGSAFQLSQQAGGVMGLEGHIYQNVSGTIPFDGAAYPGQDSFSTAIHLRSDSSAAPANHAALITGSGNPGVANEYGFWNGITLTRSMWYHNGNGAGIPGTVGINCYTWNDGAHPEIGWKVGKAGTHIYRGADLFSINTSELYVTQPAGEGAGTAITINTGNANDSRLNLYNANTLKAFLAWRPSLSRLVLSAETGEFYLSVGGVNRLVTDVNGHTKPAADNTYNSGGASFRWANLYAGSGTILTSDEREKQDIAPITDAVLDAWADVDFQSFRMKDAVLAKGDEARTHFGVVAQQVKETFEAHGLDACDYGLLCFDTFTGGDRFGVRYDEAMVLEAALTRRRLTAIEAALAAFP